MRTFATIAFCTIAVLSLKAQDTSPFDTAAHYTLINSVADQTSTYPAIILQNAPFRGDTGVYVNGVYAGDFLPESSLIETVHIDRLYDTAFAVSVEFMIQEYPDRPKPIMIIGNAWRYLGFNLSSSGQPYWVLNSASAPTSEFVVDTGTWYQATIIYTSEDTTAQFWINDQLLEERAAKLVRSNNDGKVSNTDFGNGVAYKGFWRNLVIMSDEGETTSTTDVSPKSKLQLFPNPATNTLNIRHPDNRLTWEIFDVDGRQIGKGNTIDGKQINVSDLAPGLYSIRTMAPQGQIEVRKWVKVDAN